MQDRIARGSGEGECPPGTGRSIVQEMHSIARDNLRTMTAVTIGSMTSVLAVVLNVIYFLFYHGTH